MLNINIRPLREDELFQINQYLIEFHLDNENIDVNNTFVAEVNGELAGFGRIKKYKNCFELCSLGVLEKFIMLGIGKKLVMFLIEIFPDNEVWITTKIPEYFKNLGFVNTQHPPKEVIDKCNNFCRKCNSNTFTSSFMVYKKN